MAVTVARKRRLCGPKVRTGCKTCKIRRVKCDEEKPECRRCSTTGRSCDGYSPEALLTSPENCSAIARIHRMATNLPGNTEEKRGFSYFLKNTAPELSGYFSNDFWENLILQASAGEPSLRHAVIAIGSLHEDFAHKKLEYSEEGGSKFAVDQYAKAIALLRKSLSNGKHSPLAAIMSCILFVCFDSIRGHFTSAMVHLQSGLRILQDLRKRGTSDSYLVENMIAPLFMRLSLQAILFVDTRSSSDRRAFASELTRTNNYDIPVPETFNSLEEARNSMGFAADGLFRMLYMCDGDLPFCYQPAESYELLMRYSKRLDDWNMAYGKFMVARSKSFSGRELRGAALLKIQHTIVNIMARASEASIEDNIRKFGEVVNAPDTQIPMLKDFQIVVGLSRSLIAAAEQDAKAGKTSLTFSTELGIIGPLYYVCTHCQDFDVRNQALELLKRCPRREGMWDGQAVSLMIEEFWMVEAQHKSMQEERETSLGVYVPLGEMVDLRLDDMMKWKWVWRDGRTTRSTTPEHVWTDLLADQSLFGGFFQMSGLDGTGNI